MTSSGSTSSAARKTRLSPVSIVASVIFMALGLHHMKNVSSISAGSGSKIQTTESNIVFRPLVNRSLHAEDPWKMQLFQRLDSLRQKCGDLCAINSLADIDTFAQSKQNHNGNFFSLQVKFVCPSLLEMEELDAGDTTVPYPPPQELMEYYSMSGAVRVLMEKRYQNVYLGGDAMSTVWTKDFVEEQMVKLKTFTQQETYRGVSVLFFKKCIMYCLCQGKLTQCRLFVLKGWQAYGAKIAKVGRSQG